MSEQHEARIKYLETLILQLLPRNDVGAVPAATHGNFEGSSRSERTLYQKQATLRHAPPLTEKEIDDIWPRLPQGRYLTTAQWALMLDPDGGKNAMRKAGRHLYWLAQKGLIKWANKQAGYKIPITGPCTVGQSATPPERL